jgi:predicted deacylase
VSELDPVRDASGSAHCLRFRVADLLDGTPLTSPVALLAGRRRLPKMVVVAVGAGDEFEGARAVMQLAHELERD